MALWLVRHAQPLDAAGRCYGRLDLAACPAATASAAQALAQVLPQRLPVYTSPLQRCEQLALALQALRPDLAYKTEPRLQELDFGRWEGQPWSAVPRTELDAWAADLAHYRPGGGEALAAMLVRVQQALAATPTPAVWISHAGVARCLAWLRSAAPGQLPQAQDWTLPAPAFGAWCCYPALPPQSSA